MAGTTDITLATPVSELPGVGPKTAEKLAKLGLTNVGRLIAYLPLRHERQEAEATIEDLKPGQLVSARGEVTATRPAGHGKRPRFEAVLMDHTGRLDLVWFNQMYLRTRIHPGMRLRVQGPAKRFGPGIQIANPRFEVLPAEGEEPAAREARIRPVYPATETVPSMQIESAIRAVLPRALELIEEHLPDDHRRSRHMPTLADAYRAFHAPQNEDEVAAARRRLAYDELLLLQLGVHMKRAHLRRVMRAPALKWNEQVDAAIRARFPFTLTPGQESVVKELAADLASATPTNRLIQGDVGAGKTIVALYAMLMAVASEQQAALMAPTEILAEQHFLSISKTLEGSRVRVELLTGGTPKGERESILGRLEAGEIDLLIGTHALLTESVRFRSLAVAIIDEQHRFGVHQRATLRSKATQDAADAARPLTPHLLVMTATPIPRTLAITLFGDLDISTIRGLPPGRIPIATRVVGVDKRADVYTYIGERLGRGEQAYVVVPAIDTGESSGGDGESGEIRDLRSVLASLEENELRGKRLAALHGRLKRSTREHIMERFRQGLVDALVATTVIEVGVDVPNATMMVVEHAERFGLAQLHQLRGRVGRGSKRSVCVLIGEPVTPEAEQRLKVVASTSDGFALAERDLEIRGPGEVFGTRQAGLPPFKVADLARDMDLLSMARRDAAEWISRSPTLSGEDERVLLRRLLKTYGETLGLGDVG
jgi:ATP-dependent DNA helicase RecG